MDDLKSFTYVLAVAECKSISKAAELLYISQPSLSRFISSLEQELGILLFERKSDRGWRNLCCVWKRNQTFEQHNGA